MDKENFYRTEDVYAQVVHEADWTLEPDQWKPEKAGWSPETDAGYRQVAKGAADQSEGNAGDHTTSRSRASTLGGVCLFGSNQDYVEFTLDLQEHGSQVFRFGAEGWIGNVVQRTMQALGYPKREVVRQKLLGRVQQALRELRLANAKVRRARANRWGTRRRVVDSLLDSPQAQGAGQYNRNTPKAVAQSRLKQQRSSVVETEKQQEEAKQRSEHMKLSESLPLDLAVSHGLVLLLCDEMVLAKEWLTYAISIYPHDLRLHKMIAVPYIHDNTIDWRGVMVARLLDMLEGLTQPDAEIVALKGSICRILWLQDLTNKQMAERAIDNYLMSFSMTQEFEKKSNRVGSSLGFGANRAATICAQLYESARKAGRRLVGRMYNRKCRHCLTALLAYVQKASADTNTNKQLSNDRYFAYNTAFALFGLGRYQEAADAVDKYSQLVRKDANRGSYHFEYAISVDFTNIVKIIVFSGVSVPPFSQPMPCEQWHVAWLALAKAFSLDRGGSTPISVSREMIAGCTRGKVGLAFSGGGFRAALMHLGVLARLAECDVLRSVSAISCVSGGSVVGAMYTVMLKDLLETKNDDEITRADFVTLVQQLIQAFTCACTQDLYHSSFINPLKNLAIAFIKGRTRTKLLAEQYHSKIFRFLSKNGQKILMREMAVCPKGWEKSSSSSSVKFNPRMHNWCRQTKVPALYLNCTTLNTGHLWRFTNTYMGEKVNMHESYDKGNNSVLLNVPYSTAQAPHCNISLSDAVSASASVPGFFEPFELSGLYGDFTVRLTDGGIFDNQGIASLQAAEVNLMICSDGSRHVEDQLNPSRSAISVLFRCLDISLDLSFEKHLQSLYHEQMRNGVRESCFVHMQQKNEMGDGSGPFEGAPKLNFVRPKTRTGKGSHLREGTEALDKHMEHKAQSFESMLAVTHCKTFYQHLIPLLNNVRTNLDRFTELEMFTLMAAGYIQTRDDLYSMQNKMDEQPQIEDHQSVYLFQGTVKEEDQEEEDAEEDAEEGEDAVASYDIGWGAFDVHSPLEPVWPFLSIKMMLEQEVDGRELPSNNSFEAPSQAPAASNRRSSSKALLDRRINPAFVELYQHLVCSSAQFEVLRVYKRRKILFVANLLLIVFSLGLGIYEIVDNFVDSGHFYTKNCFCFTQDPAWFTLLVLGFIFLFIAPGWGRKLVWHSLLVPAFAFTHLYIFGPVTAWRRSQSKLIQLYNDHCLSEADHIHISSPEELALDGGSGNGGGLRVDTRL